MKFTKMHGAGNDYVFIDCTGREIEAPGMLTKQIQNRHFGIGSDGLVLIKKSEVADFSMDMYNKDGSRAEMCGNAIRCVGKFVYDKGLSKKKIMTIETLAGIKTLTLEIKGDTVIGATVSMGSPVLNPKAIPVNLSGDMVKNHPLKTGTERFLITCVSMGNPHCVIFCEDPGKIELQDVGPRIETHPLFPNRVNVEFASVYRDEISMRVWERGAGETLACGTGACACLVASNLCNLTGERATVHAKGGKLTVWWDKIRNDVFLYGPAVTVFEGEFIE